MPVHKIKSEIIQILIFPVYLHQITGETDRISGYEQIGHDSAATVYRTSANRLVFKFFIKMYTIFLRKFPMQQALINIGIIFFFSFVILSGYFFETEDA